MELKEMTIEQLEERKAAIAVEVDAPEADLDALEAEARGIKEEIESRKAEEAKKVEIRKAVAEGEGVVIKTPEVEERKVMDVKEIRNSDAYIEAFAKYVKTNDATECRSLLSDNVQNGVVPVPDFVGGIVAERLKESKILARVRKMNAAGNVKIGFEISAPPAVFHGEGENAVTEEALELGIVTLNPVTLKKWVSISDEALDSMSGQAYLEYIYDEVARGIVKAAEFGVLRSIINSPSVASATQPSVPSLSVQDFGIADFVNARARLGGGAEDLVIIVSPSDYAAYRAIQMGGTYGADPFDGIEVIISEYATAPIIGDLAGVLVNYPKGDAIEFKYDDKTDMTKDLVRILGRQPVAIGVVGDKFFATINKQSS